jgi:uncharacterized protein (DUF2141 family)
MKASSAILLLLLGLAATPALAQTDCKGDTTLTVQVSGMDAPKGQVAITIYGSNPRKFLAPGAKLARQRIKTVAPVSEACFDLPGPGIYAVAVYHDANANSDFDRSPLGMPAEGFGFSNDAPTRFGLPSFDSVKFTAKAGSNLMRIKLRYIK